MDLSVNLFPSFLGLRERYFQMSESVYPPWVSPRSHYDIGIFECPTLCRREEVWYLWSTLPLRLLRSEQLPGWERCF